MAAFTPTPSFHVHLTVHHSFRTRDVSASVASGSWCKFRGVDRTASYCVICRLMDATVTVYSAAVFKFRVAGYWTALKLQGTKAVASVGRPHVLLMTCMCSSCHQTCHSFREPLSMFLCGLRLLRGAPTRCPTPNLLGPETWLMVWEGAPPFSLIPVSPH